MIGDKNINICLSDLVSSTNLLSYSVYQQLGLGEFKPTKVTIQLADHFVKNLIAEIKDILIRVGESIFPVDFIIFETQSVKNLISHIPLILQQTFLATLNPLINCRNKSMKISFGNMIIDFNIFNLENQPNEPFINLWKLVKSMKILKMKH